MKFIITSIFIFTSFFAFGQNIELILTNLGEITPGTQTIKLSYRATTDYPDLSGRQLWSEQRITVGWQPSTGISNSGGTFSTEIINFTNLNPNFTFVNGVGPLSNSVIVYDYTDLAGISDGNLYFTVTTGQGEFSQPFMTNDVIDMFQFDYVLPAAPLKSGNPTYRLAPGEIFIDEGLQILSDIQIGTDLPNLSTGTSELLGSTSTQLPVDFISFTAKKRSGSVELSWETASEINNDYFDVERSRDGKSFEAIGKVAGHGTTTEIQNYEFIDRLPYSGKNYYRLKQVDFNGTYEYSDVRVVDFSKRGTVINIFPNPTADYVSINFDKQYQSGDIVNQAGIKIKAIPTSSDQAKVNVSDLPAGIYHIELFDGNEITTKKFIKVN